MTDISINHVIQNKLWLQFNYYIYSTSRITMTRQINQLVTA